MAANFPIRSRLAQEAHSDDHAIQMFVYFERQRAALKIHCLVLERMSLP